MEQGQWQEIIATSEAMLGLAREQQWQQLQQLEVTRRSLLERFFSTPVLESDASGIRQGIQHIMEIDKQIYQMSRQAMEELGQQMDDINKNKKAVSAYQKNSR